MAECSFCEAMQTNKQSRGIAGDEFGCGDARAAVFILYLGNVEQDFSLVRIHGVQADLPGDVAGLDLEAKKKNRGYL